MPLFCLRSVQRLLIAFWAQYSLLAFDVLIDLVAHFYPCSPLVAARAFPIPCSNVHSILPLLRTAELRYWLDSAVLENPSVSPKCLRWRRKTKPTGHGRLVTLRVARIASFIPALCPPE